MDDKDEHSSDSDWSDLDEETEELENHSVCLFCKETFDLTSKTLTHMLDRHCFGLTEFCGRKNIDFYGYIKLVNYIRANKLKSEDAKNLEKSDFDDDQFYKPVLEDDMLLQIDFDDVMMEQFHAVEGVSKGKDEEFGKKLKSAEERALTAEQNLARAVKDFEACKTEMQQVLLGQLEAMPKERPSEGDDSHYFQSYAHYGIHEEMLKDTTRTETYKQFILSNSDYFKDKIVLDVGCGTGILSMFAAEAGAKLVFAIDQSEIAYQAMDIVRENKLDHVVKVKKCNAEDFVLPENIVKVDIIISEWMGYFLLFESMLDTILTCRDKLLAKDGMVYPDGCSMSLAAISDHELWDGKIDFWDNVHGYKMSCMKKHVMREALIDIVDPKKIISKPTEIVKFDIMTVKVEDLDYEEEFELCVTKTALCTGIVGYFDIGFQGGVSNPISFSTSWESIPTHWKQTIFLFPEKLSVDDGEMLKCAIQCTKDPKDPRSLIVKLHVVKGDKSKEIKQLYVIN